MLLYEAALSNLKSELYQEVMVRGIYDIDRKSNGVNLAEKEANFVKDVTGESTNYPTHQGSHSNYDDKIQKIIDKYTEKLETEFGSLKSIEDNKVLEKVLLDIEKESLVILQSFKGTRLN